MPQEIIANRVKELTPEYRDFVMSDFIDVIALEINSRYRLNEDQLLVFQNGVFLYIILFFNQFQLTEFLVTECKLPIKISRRIVSEVLTRLPNEMIAAQSAVLMELANDADAQVKEKNRMQILQATEPLLFPYIYARTNFTKRGLLNKITNEDQIAILQDLLGDIILGFYKIEDTVPLLQQELGLDAKTAALLGAEVLDFLAPLSDPNWQLPAESEYGDADEPELASAPGTPLTTPAFNIPVSTASLAATSVPAATEEPADTTLEPVAPVANIAQNKYGVTPVPDNTPVYTSSQESIRPPLSDLPSYNTPKYQDPKPAPDKPLERPRWGS